MAQPGSALASGARSRWFKSSRPDFYFTGSSMELFFDVVIVILSYLLGSVSTGYIIAKYFYKIDLKTVGSGNIGATNVMRALGKKMGIMTLIGDALKGVIPTLFAIIYKPFPINQPLVFFCALFAFLGHLFPFYLKFKGGKGVATALGIAVILFPLQTLLCAIVFFIAVLKTRMVSVGSMLAALSLPVFVSFKAQSGYMVTLSIILSILIVFKHKDNIHRILEGKENKLKW